MVKNERSIVSFAGSVPNYPLLAVGAIVLFFLIAGIISALRMQNTLFAILFGVSLLGTAIFFLINLNFRKRLTGSEKNKNLAWNIELPSSQQTKLKSEVIGLAKIMDISQEQLSELLSAYIVAEDLALRQIQQESRTPVLRHVQIGEISFDGILVKQDLITCIEVTFLIAPTITQEKINLYLDKMAAVKKFLEESKLDGRMRFLLVLVTQLDQRGEAELRSSLVKKFADTTVEVDIRMLDFEGLQKVYALI
jgi:hypothetical protein